MYSKGWQIFVNIMRVFVLIFNPGTDNEGIHTIQFKEGNLMRNKVIMFESEDDATRYALLLEAQDFPTPSVEAIDDDEIKEFCGDANYDWELIPANSLAIPPENNLDELDWETEKKVPPEESEISASELENIRRRLEGLL